MLYSPLVTSLTSVGFFPVGTKLQSSVALVCIWVFSILGWSLILWTSFLFSSRTTFQLLLLLRSIQVNTFVHCTICMWVCNSLNLPSFLLLIHCCECCSLISSPLLIYVFLCVCSLHVWPVYPSSHTWWYFSTFGLFLCPILGIPMIGQRNRPKVEKNHQV